MSQPKKMQKKSLLSTVGVVIVAALLLLGQQMGLLPGAEEAASTAAIIEPQAIVNYLAAHGGQLPDNFITKAEAEALGWDSAKNYVSDVAPGKSIGGDRFGNYEGILPAGQYREADCYYTEGKRNAYRLVYSASQYFYTEDHYETFEELHPEK